jgi:hypothetical protein
MHVATIFLMTIVVITTNFCSIFGIERAENAKCVDFIGFIAIYAFI